MRNSAQLQVKITQAIKKDTKINMAGIRVDVTDGIVTFDGVVDCYWKKVRAEEHAKKYDEVKMIINEIKVVLKPFSQKSDKEVADAVINAFKWHNLIPAEKVEVHLQNGWLTVSGTLEDWTHKEAVEEVILKVEGVVGFSNEISIRRKEVKPNSFTKARETCYKVATTFFGTPRFAY